MGFLSKALKSISGSAGSILGSVFGAGISAYGQSQANQANEEEAERNRRFQERMSNTAHRREVRDLKAAGLNPILSATGGRGADTPSGSMARIENTAKDVSRNVAATSKIAAELRQLKAGTAYTEKQAQVASQQIQYVKAQTAQSIASAQSLSVKTALDNQLKAMYERNPGLLAKERAGWIFGIPDIMQTPPNMGIEGLNIPPPKGRERIINKGAKRRHQERTK